MDTVGTGADGTTEVVVHGDVDIAVEDVIHAALDEDVTAAAARRQAVRIDLADVAFMDSAGLRSLFEVAGVAEWLLGTRNGDTASEPGP